MEMTRLQSLRMRNNPIKVIPDGRYYSGYTSLLFGSQFYWERGMVGGGRERIHLGNNLLCVFTFDSSDIQKLEKLKVFCISFNLLTNLPPG